ncbi:hypothetical protein DL770_010622 [Monosporascus sp. CRB-9-2]|nr:hypothetical protein DL770_010622 [Monosporascus sp. CRB-9-2]
MALKSRAMLLPMIFGVYGVRSVTGLLIGGVITDNKTLSWRFIFWIKLHLVYFKESSTNSKSRTIAYQENTCTIPLYIFRNRTSVKDTSAKDSGIYLHPLVISNSLTTLSAGWITSKVEYYVPFMCIGAPILAAGDGLYQLIRLHSPASEWIGAGAKEFRKLISSELMDEVIEAFGSALRDVFLLALAGAVVALAISSAMEWRRFPQDRKREDSASETTQAPPAQDVEKEPMGNNSVAAII